MIANRAKTLLLLALMALPAVSAPTRRRAPAAKAKPTGRLVEVKRESRVFQSPSGKSKVLADVGPGTVLSLLDVSSQGTWLMVEDEDGNIGWLPRNRSDYVPGAPPVREVAPRSAKAPPAPGPDEESEVSGDLDPKIRTKPATGERNAEILPLVRVSFTDPNGKLAAGALGSFFSKPVTTGGDRWHQFGLQTGYLHVLKTDKKRSPRGGIGFTVPVRLRMLAWNPGSRFQSGPDFGFQYMRRPHPTFDKNIFSFAFGYSLAFALGSGLTPWLRGAFDVKHGARASLEAGVGWAL